MIEYRSLSGEGALAAAGLGATVTEAPGYPSPASEAQKPAGGFASADPAAAVAGAQIRVTVNFRFGAKHQDLLTIGSAESGTFTSGGGEAIAFAYDRTTGVLTLSGTASAGAYDEAFEAVRFAIAGDDPDDGGTAASRTIVYSTFDGAAYSDLVEANVAVVAVNDAPTLDILGTHAARLGGEAVVDTSSGSDREVSMTALTGGGYLITWTHSSSMGGDPSVINGQRFDASGVAVGAKITLASSAGSSAYASASAAFADGGFVIAWEGSSGLVAQRFNASGVKIGGQIVVSANLNNSQVEPTVAVLAGGGFIVAWHNVYQDGSGEAVLARRYDASGVAQGSAVRVNSFTANDQHFAAATGLADGGYVITWTSWQQDAPGAGIYGQRFNAAGVAQGGEFRINATVAGNQQDPSIAALADGGFVVTWSSLGFAWNDRSHIYAQRFDSAGNAVGGEIKVSVNAAGNEPAVTSLADGGFAIVWQSGEIYARRYGADGQPVGPEAQVNTHAMGTQWHPAAAGLAGGDFVVGWADLNQGGGYSGVFQQRYTDGFAVDEGFALLLNGRIDLDDVDAGTGAITVILSVDQGVLFYAPLAANAATATGDGTSTLRITGSLADVKAFLGSDTFLGYQNDSDAPPANAHLTVRVEDEGGTGGDPLAVEKTVVIGIVPVNDKPVLSAATSTTLAFTEGDGPLALMQGVTASDPDLPASFRSGGFDLSVNGGTGALQLREGSAFQLTSDMYGGYSVSHPSGSASVAYLTGIGTRSISVTFRTSTMTPALASDFIDDFVFTDSSDNPAAGNRTASLSFFDGQNLGLGTSPRATTTQTIAVTPVNDAPTVEWASGFGYEDMSRTTVFIAGKDADNTTLTYTLASLPEHGILYSAATGGVVLSVGSAISVTPGGLAAAYFQPDLNWNGSTAFTFTVSDGSLSTGAQTATIAIRATNDAPVFSGVATVNAVEQTQVVLLAGTTVSDLELDPRNGGAGDYSGSILSIGGSIPVRSSDQFALVGGPSFTIDGNNLKAGGLIFGAITGNSNGLLTVAFTGAQTPVTRALVNEVMQAVRYTSATDAPSDLFPVALTLNDGGDTNDQGYPGRAFGSSWIYINMTRVNDGPSSTLLGGDVATWTEGNTTRLLDPTGNATIADVDSANFDGGSLTVAIGAGGISAQDRLVLTATGGVTFTATTVSVAGTQIATYTGGGAGPLVFRFDPDATPAAVQTLVRSIAYTNIGGDNPTSGARTIDWTLVDGDGTANSGVDRLNLVSTVNVVAVDDPPVSTGSTATRVFTEGVNGAADHIVVNDTIVLSDPDDATFAIVQVIIVNNYVRGEDVFTFVNTDPALYGDITSSFDSSIGFLSLRSPSGTATQAQFQAAVRTVTYDNLSEDPTPGDRSVQVRALNHAWVSGAVGFTLQVVARNDSPSGANRTIAINEDEVRTLAVADFGFSDVDGDGFRSVRFGSAPTGGTLYWDADGAGGVAPVAITGFPTGEYLATDIALGKLTFVPEANRNGAGIGTIVFTVLDDGGTSAGGQNAAVTANILTVDVAAVDDVAGTADDSAATSERAPVDISVLANDGDDVDGPWQPGAALKPLITHIAGQSVSTGQKVILSSGATVTLSHGGVLSYDPNGQFAKLTDSSSGAANTLAVDTFAYSVAGGGTATVGVTVHGVAGPGDELRGDGGSNRITGTGGVDRLLLQDGGDDTVLAGGGDDSIFFIGSLTAADVVNGGTGTDTLVLQGPYGSLRLSADVTEIENVSILGGNNTNFGDPGTNLYDYVLTTNNANFAPGVQARINGAALLAGEDFTFDGSAETDAKFVVYGGKGVDTLTGGYGNDIFIYPEERFAAGDTVNGGPGGYDGIFFRGNYTIDFNASGYFGLMTSIENMTLTSATDERYARGGGTEFDYNITLADNMLLAGVELTVSGALLMATETMVLDGSLEMDGTYRLFGGKANDVLKGGAQNDLLHGNLGADQLTGNGGVDTFRYDSTAHSNSGSRDEILDFTPGTDKIDLSRIDASTLAAGNQAFSWIGSNAFDGTAGQLRAFQSGGTWIVEGDTNGDSIADLVIALTLQGPTPLGAGDFLL